MNAQFEATDRFQPEAMQQFMRRPDIYWSGTDALAPPPESVDFVAHMLHPDTWITAALFNGHIIGYVQFLRRTSICAEIHVGFHPQCRGKVARGFVQDAIFKAFKTKGLLKLLAVIPSDNRPAILGARHIGFVQEGRLTRAIVRQNDGGTPLRDLIILGLSKET